MNWLAGATYSLGAVRGGRSGFNVALTGALLMRHGLSSSQAQTKGSLRNGVLIIGWCLSVYVRRVNRLMGGSAFINGFSYMLK